MRDAFARARGEYYCGSVDLRTILRRPNVTLILSTIREPRDSYFSPDTSTNLAGKQFKEISCMSPHLSKVFILRLSIGSAVLCTAGVATLAARQPAVASSFIAAANTLVTCATSTACVTGTNTGYGTGVSGTSINGFGVTATSTNASGIYAKSTKSNGIFAYSAESSGVGGSSANKFGVFGSSGGVGRNAAGVFGLGTQTGVMGATSQGDGYGVIGYVSTGTGIEGLASDNGIGAYGGSQHGVGVWAASATGTGVNASSSAGIAVRAHSYGGGFSVVGTSDNLLGAGADFEGGRYGIVGRAIPSGFPLVLTDSTYHNVFYVSGTGDVYLHGQVLSFVRTAGGATVSSYTAKSSQPTVEDTGTAQLTAGAATVMLDPAFAATIDKSAAYRVFLTPDGDTRGLFVAQKTARGFSVRETQGGHSTLAFDYRIVATGDGQVGKRMMVQTAPEMPKTPIVPQTELTVPKQPKPPNVDASLLTDHPHRAP